MTQAGRHGCSAQMHLWHQFLQGLHAARQAAHAGAKGAQQPREPFGQPRDGQPRPRRATSYAPTSLRRPSEPQRLCFLASRRPARPTQGACEAGARPSHWEEEDGEAFEEEGPASQPAPARTPTPRFSEAADYFGKAEPLLAPTWQENPAGCDPSWPLAQAASSWGISPVKATPTLLEPEAPGKASLPLATNIRRLLLTGQQKQECCQHQGLPGHLEDQRHPWSEEDERGGGGGGGRKEEEELLLASEMNFPRKQGLRAASQPRPHPTASPGAEADIPKALQTVASSTAAAAALRDGACSAGGEAWAASHGCGGQGPRLSLRSWGWGAHPWTSCSWTRPLGGPLGLDPFLDGDPGVALKPEEAEMPLLP